jgi:phosphoglycolate phosphatase-like HAD superfamily hydrolase
VTYTRVFSSDLFFILAALLYEAPRVFAPVNGIIFDMDGTLTHPGAIDFGAMYRRAGLDRANGDIIAQLEASTTLSPEAKEAAYKVIIEEEVKGIANMKIREDLLNLLDMLYRARIRTAISTRNCELALDKFVEAANIAHHRYGSLIQDFQSV